MISIEKLSEILNKELTREFLDAAIRLYDDDNMPIDPEHPDMELALEKITEAINDMIDILPIKDDYDR